MGKDSDSEHAQQEHNQGQADASNASFLDKMENFAESVVTGHSDAYDKGWDNGLANPSEED